MLQLILRGGVLGREPEPVRGSNGRHQQLLSILIFASASVATGVCESWLFVSKTA